MTLKPYFRTAALKGLLSIVSVLMIVLLIHGCGERTLPANPPAHKGKVIITGAAV